MQRSFFLIGLMGGVLAVSASGSTLNNDVNCNSTYFGSCTAQEGGATGANTNLDWMEISGDAYNNAGMLQDDTLLTTGGSGGSFVGGNIPVAWDFTLTTAFSGEVIWDLTAEINTDAGNGSLSMNGEVDCPCTDTPVEGTGSFNVAAGDITGWQYELNAGGIAAFDELTINVPGGGLELNAPVTSAVPEPANAGLLLAGIGLAGFAIRRRRTA
jgi:hypothetical protein